MFTTTAVDITGTATITITAAYIEGALSNSASGSFDIELLTPCTDQSFVIIQTGDLPDVNYAPLLSSTALSPLIRPQADTYSIATLPFQHNMCGSLSYSGGSDTVTELQYIEANSEFSLHIENSNRNYDGSTHEYYLEAYLSQYPDNA